MYENYEYKRSVSDGYKDRSSSTETKLPSQKNPYRLPTNLAPLHYTLNLVPYLEEGFFNFTGEVTATFIVLAETAEIVMHAANLTIKTEDISLKDARNGSLNTVLRTEFDEVHQLFKVFIDSTLDVGREYNLSIAYSGDINDEFLGFFRTSYKSQDGRKRWIAATQFSPTYARRMLPCWDEPSFRATFQLRVARPEHFNTISTTRALSTSSPDPSIGDRVWDTFAPSISMPTYLLGVVMSEYNKSLPNQVGNFTIWSREEVLDLGESALRWGPAFLSWNEEYTGIPYQGEKIDLVALPGFFFNAMENWGVITFRESALLGKVDVSPARTFRQILYVLGHELTHQWFGNFVTIHWWANAWLKEGFATYFSTVASAAIEPDSGLDKQFVPVHVQSSMAVDSIETTHALSNSELDDSPTQILANMDTITYSKGASIVRMMEKMLGRKIFKNGLRKYLSNNALGTGDPDKLYAALQTAIDEDDEVQNLLPRNVSSVSDVMKPWNSQPGHPVITVHRTYDSSNNSIHFEQARFLLHLPSNDTDVSQSWWVPLWYSTPKTPLTEATRAQYWLPPNGGLSINLTAPVNDWILFNPAQRGYFRVNYDVGNWRLLAQALRSQDPLLTSDTRAQLVDDSMSLARAGLLPYPVAFDVVSFLKSELELEPWMSARRAFSHLDAQLRGSSADEAYKTYIVGLLSTAYTRLGWQTLRTSSQRDRLTRSIITQWACDVGEERCVRDALKDYREWQRSFDGATSKVSADTLASSLCMGVRQGSSSEFHQILDRLLETKEDGIRANFIHGLACSNSASDTFRLLNMTTRKISDSGLRRNDASNIFAEVIHSGATGVSSVLDFLAKYWDAIITGSGKGVVESTIRRLAERVSNSDQYTVIRSMIAKQNQTEKSVKTTVRLLEANERWKQEHFETISRYLFASSATRNRP